jgi:hypothetical protein
MTKIVSRITSSPGVGISISFISGSQKGPPNAIAKIYVVVK